MEIKLRPLADRVLVEPIEQELKTSSGLWLPESLGEKPQKGLVLSVGSGRWNGATRVPPEVEKGDVIVFSKYAGTEIKVDDKTYLILDGKDILGCLGGDGWELPSSLP